MIQKNMLKLAIVGLTAGLCLSAESNAAGKEIAFAKCSKNPPIHSEKSSCQSKTDDEGSCSGNCGGGASCTTPGDCNDVGQMDESHSEKMTEKRISVARRDDK